MEAAVKAVSKGLTVREAARKFDIPESTMRKISTSGGEYKARLGRKEVFSETEEKKLVDYILLMAKLYYGLTPMQIRRLAYDFAEAVLLSTPVTLCGSRERRQYVSNKKISSIVCTLCVL